MICISILPYILVLVLGPERTQLLSTVDHCILNRAPYTKFFDCTDFAARIILAFYS